ncbi:MAG: glyoxalase [Rhodobacterales bacterium]|nr:MAG: glyoxalase [Rhodobacterales bacterium]
MTLEHVNVTVSDAAATARWLGDVFGWRIRWEGDSKAGGHSKHVGGDDFYVVAYQAPEKSDLRGADYRSTGWLNHIGVVVDDLNAVEERVRAAGFTPYNHGDYEPGRRFYFDDADGIEWEVVSYD